jgi:hypothetical protein
LKYNTNAAAAAESKTPRNGREPPRSAEKRTYVRGHAERPAPTETH